MCDLRSLCVYYLWFPWTRVPPFSSWRGWLSQARWARRPRPQETSARSSTRRRWRRLSSSMTTDKSATETTGFCWHCHTTCHSTTHIQWIGQEVVNCCCVTLWSVLLASPFFYKWEGWEQITFYLAKLMTIMCIAITGDNSWACAIPRYQVRPLLYLKHFRKTACVN